MRSPSTPKRQARTGFGVGERCKVNDILCAPCTNCSWHKLDKEVYRSTSRVPVLDEHGGQRTRGRDSILLLSCIAYQQPPQTDSKKRLCRQYPTAPTSEARRRHIYHLWRFLNHWIQCVTGCPTLGLKVISARAQKRNGQRLLVSTC